MPGALTHTRITWSLSPMAPQVLGVTPGSPLRPWCWGHSLWRGARHASSLWVMFLNIVWLLVVSWGGAFGGVSDCRSFTLV
jgi:hypothetical protein